MPKGEKAFISLRFPCGKGFYFFDMTAPGSRVQAVERPPEASRCLQLVPPGCPPTAWTLEPGAVMSKKSKTFPIW